MQKYQTGSTEWIKQELAGLLGQQVTQDIADSIRLYEIYSGEGQIWHPDTKRLDYRPTVRVTNLVKKLIKEEARFMMGVEPEIRIHPLNAAGEQDRAACAQIEDWLSDFLRRNKWGDKLIKGARDCFIGKRVALKLTGAPGKPLGVQFRPSLEFVYDTDPEDVDKLSKVIFFYHKGKDGGWTVANETVREIPLANVARVEVVTEETEPKTYVVGTSNELTLEAFVSEGEEKELRKNNRLIAQLKTEDLVKGYNITVKDLVMHPFVFALVDGGQSTVSEEGAFSYTGPRMGEVVKRTPFTMNIYTEEKDGDGETVAYLKITVAHCKGSPASVTVKDGEFYAPEYTVKSRPKIGESPLTITQLEELPEAV